MPTPQYHDTPDIVIAVTRWLMRRACLRLSFEWRTVSRTPEAVNATPQPTVH